MSQKGKENLLVMSSVKKLGDFYLGIWNSLPHPGFIVKSNYEIVAANSASETYCSTSRTRISGRMISSFLSESSYILKVIRQTKKQQTPIVAHSVDIYWVGRNVEICNLYCSPLEGSDDSILLLIQPTTKVNKMNRNLLHQNAARSISGLAAMLGHEIRNPLAGISGAAQLLAQNASDEDLKLTDLIRSESKRIGDLVSRFEIFGDIAPVIRTSLNVHDVLEKTKELAKASFSQHIRFYEDYDPSLPNIKGNFDQLTQVFLNLLKNASEAVPATGGKIKICTSYRSGLKLLSMNKRIENLPITIEIIDNGKGIPSDMSDSIFEPFIGTKKVGSGLGLALVSKVIADHGGSIEYSSMEGKTVFNISLPIQGLDEGELSDYNIHSRLLSKDGAA